jgi:hypothetical protein
VEVTLVLDLANNTVLMSACFLGRLEAGEDGGGEAAAVHDAFVAVWELHAFAACQQRAEDVARALRPGEEGHARAGLELTFSKR